MSNLIEKQKMAQRVSLSLEQKVQMTKQRVKAWIDAWSEVEVKANQQEFRDELSKAGFDDLGVYLAFSGGWDSTILKHIIESMGYKIPNVFSNTGLEMPEIVKFARAQDGVVEVKPKKNYHEIWKEEGIPVGSKKVAKMIRVLQEGDTGKNSNMHKLYDTGISKDGREGKAWKIPNKWRVFVDSDIKVTDKCCDHLKKEPLDSFAKMSGLKRFDAMMAEEGGMRGSLSKCNDFGTKPKSHPMLFWTQKDKEEFTSKNNLEICMVYFDRAYKDGELIECDSPHHEMPAVSLASREDSGVSVIAGEKRTGCMFCGFGVQLEKGQNRFQKMSVTHPRQHAIVMDRMGMRQAMEMINVKVDLDD